MYFKTYLTALLLCLAGTLTADAQITTVLNQVKLESQIVSGRPYKLFYVSNEANGCFVKAETNIFTVNTSATVSDDEATYYFISDDNSKWKIKSKKTQKYIP